MQHNPLSYFTRGQFVMAYINFWLHCCTDQKNRKKYFLGDAVQEMFPRVDQLRAGFSVMMEEIRCPRFVRRPKFNQHFQREKVEEKTE